MDFTAHYRRAVELAEAADRFLDFADQVNDDEKGTRAMRRAEVLARMATARAQLAWVAYMGADIDAAARLVEDAKAGPTPLDIPPRLDARRRRPGPA